MSQTQNTVIDFYNKMGENRIMDVALLWFKCKNKDCDYIPVKTKKDKIKKYWRHGESLQNAKRQIFFMRYVEGNYIRKDNGDILIFSCKYGDIYMYDKFEKHDCNNFLNPIENEESCNRCIKRIKNEGALFP